MSYIIRLDDACEKMNNEKWDRMEALLDKYNIKPLVGVIPHCDDPMMKQYPTDSAFWEKVQGWENKGWTIAMHGYNHVYSTTNGGINPVNEKSEFAGESLDIQEEKIKTGIAIMREHGIEPKVFFAPSHTFDDNTICALKKYSKIRIISDTVASDVYCKNGITFVPQQVGDARFIPLKTVTFCYHPNTMKQSGFEKLESFLNRRKEDFIPFPLELSRRKNSCFDIILKRAYFCIREIRRKHAI